MTRSIGLWLVLVLLWGTERPVQGQEAKNSPDKGKNQADGQAEADLKDDSEKQLSAFASSISTESPLGKRLHDALQGKAGQIVVSGRAAFAEQTLRDKAREEALPAFLEQYFVADGDKYRLRPGKESYRDQVLKASGVYQEDVQKVQSVVAEVVANLAGESETDLLVRRFLSHASAAEMLYVQELRTRLRPDEALVQQRLADTFVANSQGQYVVRAAQRIEAERTLKRVARMQIGKARIHQELREWAQEFAATDDFHKSFKEALADPMYAAFVAFEALDGDPVVIDERLESYFSNLEYQTQDSAQGIVIEPERLADLQVPFNRYRRQRAYAARVVAPLKMFASRIRKGTQPEDGCREMLETDLGLLWVTRLLSQEPETDPETATRALLDQLMIKRGADGKYQVQSESQEQVASYVQGYFSNFRQVRRKSRSLDELAEKLDDQALKQVLQSLAGKFIVSRTIQTAVGRQRFDGLTSWIEARFDRADKGLVIRPGYENEIEGVLQEVENVKKELEKNDF